MTTFFPNEAAWKAELERQLEDLKRRTFAAEPHPGLASHDTLGLATQAELDTHAASAGHTHPDLAAHDSLGLATQAELDAHSHPDYAGPTLRVSGITAPSPMSPGHNTEYGWHFQTIDHGNSTYFTYTAGSNTITVVKAGRYLISFNFGWWENPVYRADYATDGEYARYAAEFLMGDRWVHIAAGGAQVLDSHRGPNANATSQEGTTQTILGAGAQISGSYQFFDRTGNVAAANYPTVAESGVFWPHLSVTYLGPN